MPKNDSTRKADEMYYLQNPKRTFKDPDESKLLAYEVRRLSGAEKIYGIDFKKVPKKPENSITGTW